MTIKKDKEQTEEDKLPAKKSFYIENRRKIKSSLIAITIITLIIIAYFVFLNLRFTIKEDLVIELPERHISLNVTQENPSELKIYSDLQTSKLCKASCTHQLTSINSGEVLFSQDFEFRKHHKLLFEKTIYPYILGEGQDIYSYSISCTTISTANCPAKNNLIQKNAIITVTRNLTENEKIIKKSQESMLNYSYFTYNNGLFIIDSAAYIMGEISHAKKDDLEQNMGFVNEQKDRFGDLLLEMNNAWLTYNHSFIEQMLTEKNLLSYTENFKTASEDIYSSTILRIETHNEAVYKTYMLADKIKKSENALLQSKQFLNENYEILSAELKEANSILLFVNKKMQSKDFSSYSEIYNNLDGGNISVEVFKQDYLDNMINNSIFSGAQFDLFIIIDNNCLLLGNKSQSPEENNSCSANISQFLVDYTNITYEELTSNISSFCFDYYEQINIREKLFKERTGLRMNLSNESLTLLNNEYKNYTIYLLEKYREELLSRNDSSAKEAVILADNYIRIIEEENNLSKENISESDIKNYNFGLFLPINITFINITPCESLINSTIINLSYEKYPHPNISISSHEYNYSLPELLPRSCYNGVCTQYIKNSSKNYPLIIVHGHGFYSKNFRITPSDVHNDFQNSLFLDKLYVPAGTLKENDFVIENSLGYVDVPFVYKAAYYPDEVLDNESIYLFADRLNKIIKKAKQETGKEKIILVSHSMGGLVSRAYLKKYGTDDVHLFIIAGTPNYGISSDTVSLCKLFGRNLECDEMYDEGKFINDLKNEQNYTIPVYAIRGEGCPTFGDDGDGIVQSKKVILPYANNFAFNGTCNPIGDYHMNLLNPKIHPDIYEKVKEILIYNKN